MEIEGGKHQFPECIPHNGEVFFWPKEDLLTKGNGLQADLFYELHLCFWNQGIKTEALRAVCHYGYNTLRIRRFRADPQYANTVSLKLLQRVGFVDQQEPGDHEQAEMCGLSKTFRRSVEIPDLGRKCAGGALMRLRGRA